MGSASFLTANRTLDKPCRCGSGAVLAFAIRHRTAHFTKARGQGGGVIEEGTAIVGKAPGEQDPTGLESSALRPLNVLAIAVSAVSPTTSVFLVYGTGLASAGTGVVYAFLIAAVIVLAMALCYAETGSLFPSAGGAYTIVYRALGPLWGGLATVLFLLLGLVTTASVFTAAATYLSGLVPGGLPVGWTALAMLAAVTALSMGRIAPASWVAAGMLLLELVVILVFTGCALAHVTPDSRPFTHPVVPGASGLIAAVVPALFAFNGYDWPLYFAEEARGPRHMLPRAVMWAAWVSVTVELLAVVAATFAVRDAGRTAADDSPLSLIAHQVMGPTGATILLAGVVVAMFDAGLSANLGYARVYYAAARDGMLPGPLGRFFGHTSPRSRVPVHGFAFLFVGNGVLCVFSSLNDLITFTGVVIVIVCLLVAVAALVCRVRARRIAPGGRPPFRMPLWPVPPLVVVTGVAVALTQQSAHDLLIVCAVCVIAVAGYGYAVVRRPGDAGSSRRR
ncbi:APC family permease [Streptomyces aureoversilis]|uniref:APC family permease n=1 Tax=Streptomyces aureoversilis TaxID=67277 RepID=A0ABV9ZQ79_9ACTN